MGRVASASSASIDRCGIVARVVDAEEADARALFRTLADIGGAELVGPSKELDGRLYYRPSMPEN